MHAFPRTTRTKIPKYTLHTDHLTATCVLDLVLLTRTRNYPNYLHPDQDFLVRIRKLKYGDIGRPNRREKYVKGQEKGGKRERKTRKDEGKINYKEKKQNGQK
jgi:hypothetical protein